LTLERNEGSGIDNQVGYVYDASGNRTQQVNITNPNEWYGNAYASVTDYTYDANNRMISISNGGYTKTYTYDANGNMLSSSDGKTYTYDVQNRLISFANGTAQSATYNYYADGLRSSKSVTTGDFSEYNGFSWADGQLIYEYKSNTNYSPSLYYGTVYNYGLDLVSHYTTGEDSNSEYYYISDAHGDVKQLVDTSLPTLANISTNTYDAFGNGGANEYSRMGYAGEYHDHETGFIYLRARYYDPTTGRFINEDPVRDGLNWYAYCNNNPVNFVDPSGLKMYCEEEHAEDTIQYLTDLCGGSLKFAYESGQIIITKEYESENYASHTLIKNIIEAVEKINIYYVKEYENTQNQFLNSKQTVTWMKDQYGKNVSAYFIYFDPNASVYAEVKTADGSIAEEKIEPSIILGHEMIHAYHAITGVYDINSYGSNYFYPDNKTYEEEFYTVGLPFISGNGDLYQLKSYEGTLTENGLRLENGYNVRVMY